MAKLKYTWDHTALERDSVEVPFPGEIDPVVFYEFNHSTMLDYVKEIYDYNTMEDVEVDDPDKPGEKITERRVKSFETVHDEQKALICKYLSRATIPPVQAGNIPGQSKAKPAKSVQFFENLEITTYGFSKLIEMLASINHVDELVATGGNLASLPLLLKMVEIQAAAAKADSDSTSQESKTTQA